MKKIYILLHIILLIIPLVLSSNDLWDSISCGSHSMYPTINCTNSVYINLTQNVRLNDIIVFRNPDNFTVFRGRSVEEYYVMHRIVKVNRTHFITKGDNNTYDDFINHGWVVNKKDVIGKVYKIK